MSKNNQRPLHSPAHRLALAALLTLATGASRAEDVPPDAFIARDLAASCGACHGTQGRSAGGFPALAGVDRGAIIEKLKGYRSGSLPATVMHQHAKGYDERQIELIADYFSQQPRAAQQ